ncbi:MAG: exonuclease SbcCD subunit D C-terminal domain-containing protein [Prolixibacteraceae bacterium]|nr:exonuclease SbcCD subunit D C-terminal domain-containing protein [Prolixibacteraceae bacterium]
MNNESKKIRVLHTSDWHLGRSLYDRKRYDEFASFLNWLYDFIVAQRIDVLLIAGDIFDTTTPGNRAQELYYQFLSKTSKSCCRHIIVTGGNHDSPSFLNAPKDLLKALDVHVVGEITENIEQEVIVLKNNQGEAEAVVCAVPFLRDRDVRKVEAGESIEDKNRKLVTGIAVHYSDVANAARHFNDSNPVPIIGMGHLFTSRGKVNEGDGVRDLYVGTLQSIDAGIFSDKFDYVALGHLHMAQKVDGNDKIRYSGSPLPMSFSEADQQKKVIVIEFENLTISVTEHDIPCFQKLIRVSGNFDSVKGKVTELANINENLWLEIEILDSSSSGTITEELDEIIKNSPIEILRIKNSGLRNNVLMASTENETLDDLNELDVFNRCLEINNIPEEEQNQLIETYKEVLLSLRQEDTNKN